MANIQIIFFEILLVLATYFLLFQWCLSFLYSLASRAAARLAHPSVRRCHQYSLQQRVEVHCKQSVVISHRCWICLSDCLPNTPSHPIQPNPVLVQVILPRNRTCWIDHGISCTFCS
jgi:hypothetical protein